MTKQCFYFPVMLSESRTIPETRQIQGQREKNTAGHKEAALKPCDIHFSPEMQPKIKLRLMTQDMKIPG